MTHKDHILDVARERVEPDWLLDIRRDAIEEYDRAGVPSFEYGLNVLFPPRTVVMDLARFADAKQMPTAVKAPPGVIGMPLSVALRMEKYEPLLRELLAAEDGRTPNVAAWHRAHAWNGVLLHVPAGLSCERPIRLDLALADAHRVENVVIVADEGSRVTVVEHLSSGPEAPVATRSAVTDVIAGPGARVTHISVQNFGANVTDFSAKRARVARDAAVDWIECVFGADFAQSRVSTRLEGEGASSKAMAMFFGTSSQKFDLRHEAHHLASRTTSDIRTRGALDQRGKAIYRGLVRIARGTVGCTGRQREDTLMLGPDAEVDAMPDLEIGTGDVRCGHSASAGRLDKEKLFYLASRGLAERDAHKMLVSGFFAPVVADMRDSGLEEMVDCLVDARLENAA